MSAETKSARFPLHTYSVLAILACDWLVYAANMLTALDALTTVVVVGSLAAGVLCGGLERHIAGATLPSAFGTASFVALLIALPLPILGTLLSALAGLWWLSTAIIGLRTQAR